MWETKKHEEEISSLHSRTRHLQVDLTEASREKGELDAKVIELDGLVAQLLSLNETLVAQLSGRPFKATLLSTLNSSSGKKKKKKVVEKPPKVAQVSTVAAEASKTTKFTRPASQLIPVKSTEVEQLKAMHKLYATMAKSLRSSSPSKETGKMQTRMKKKKATISVDDNHLHYSTSMATPSTTNRTSHSAQDSAAKREVRMPKANVTFDSDGGEGDHGTHDHTYMSDRASRESSPMRISRVDSGHSGYYSVSSTSSNAKDLQAVISSLEEEFDSLNRQYRRLLTNVQASNSVSSSNEHDLLTSEGIQAQAEEIVNVIQKLHNKGEQLRMLKSPTR